MALLEMYTCVTAVSIGPVHASAISIILFRACIMRTYSYEHYEYTGGMRIRYNQ